MGDPLPVRLRDDHDRKTFRSCEKDLNVFLRDWQENEEELTVTWVVEDPNDSTKILAYYTVDPDPYDFLDSVYGEEDAESNYVIVRAVARDKKRSESGLGRRLVGRLIRQIKDVDRTRYHLITELVMTAINPTVRDLYLKWDFGFERHPASPLTLTLRIETIRLLEEEEL